MNFKIEIHIKTPSNYVKLEKFLETIIEIIKSTGSVITYKEISEIK